MSDFKLDPKKSSLNDPEEDSEDVLESLGDEKDDAFSSMSDDLGAEEPLEEPDPYVAPKNLLSLSVNSVILMRSPGKRHPRMVS